jgi:hypothetical protein
MIPVVPVVPIDDVETRSLYPQTPQAALRSRQSAPCHVLYCEIQLGNFSTDVTGTPNSHSHTVKTGLSSAPLPRRI